jgi:hypothetical protein
MMRRKPKRLKKSGVLHMPRNYWCSGTVFYYCGVSHSLEERDENADPYLPVCQRCVKVRGIEDARRAAATVQIVKTYSYRK